MLTIHDQIEELHAELAFCVLTRRERADARAELDRLLTAKASLDRKFDETLEAFTKKAPPG
jgi:hypothetical protein